MKKLIRVVVFELVFAVAALLLGAGLMNLVYGQQAQAHKPEVQKEQKKEDPKPVKTDEVFQETWEDWQLISSEIDRIENASGASVSIPVPLRELRVRQAAKMSRLQQWTKDHRVGPDWRYDSQQRAFIPPVPEASKQEASKK
jgi:hypothetical protein